MFLNNLTYLTQPNIPNTPNITYHNLTPNIYTYSLTAFVLRMLGWLGRVRSKGGIRHDNH